MPVTMRTFFSVVGYGTLVVDAYLILASIAAPMMEAQYRAYLPPFGSAEFGQPSRFVVLLVATWTAVLAMGCLRANDVQSVRGSAPGVLWFVLVLAIVWLVYLTPLLIGLIWNLFVRGIN